MGREQPSFVAGGVSNLVLGSAAFAISGCLVKVNRFRYLFVVAEVAWLGTLLYVVFGVATTERWMFTLLAILAMMGIGGGISYLFVRLPSGVD